MNIIVLIIIQHFISFIVIIAWCRYYFEHKHIAKAICIITIITIIIIVYFITSSHNLLMWSMYNNKQHHKSNKCGHFLFVGKSFIQKLE